MMAIATIRNEITSIYGNAG